jgi:hypothetical protein
MSGARPWLAGLAALGLVAMVPLMFADRAPGVLDRISDGIENTFPDYYWDTLKPHAPEADVAMHLMLFATAAVLVGLVCWSWPTFVAGQVAILAGGMAIEVLQPMFTSSRDIETHDMAANLLGQAMGIGFALVVIFGWSAWERWRLSR